MDQNVTDARKKLAEKFANANSQIGGKGNTPSLLAEIRNLEEKS
jgi:hypothetical protein